MIPTARKPAPGIATSTPRPPRRSSAQPGRLWRWLTGLVVLPLIATAPIVAAVASHAASGRHATPMPAATSAATFDRAAGAGATPPHGDAWSPTHSAATNPVRVRPVAATDLALSSAPVAAGPTPHGAVDRRGVLAPLVPAAPNPPSPAPPAPSPSEPAPAPDVPSTPTAPSPSEPTESPSPPPVPPAPQPPPTQEPEAPSWIGQKVTEAVNGWLGGLAADAIRPLAELAGGLLDPARLLGITQIRQLWENSRLVANSLFGLLVVLGGLVVLGHETLQTRWALKEILPRLLIGAVAANLSWWVITSAIELTAGLAVAIAGNQMTAGQILTRFIVAFVAGGGAFQLVLSLVLTVMVSALVLMFIVTLALLAVLTICSPLALCLHALPHTEPVAWLWWRALVATLATPILDAVILALIGRIMLTPGSFGVFFLPPVATAASTLLNLLVVLALLYLMLKIPRVMFRIATGRAGRGSRGMVRSTLRSALLYAGLQATGLGPALGAVGAAARRSPLHRLVGSTASSLLGGHRASSGGPGMPRSTRPHPNPSARPARATQRQASGSDPYDWESATPDGQLMLPLRGVRPGRRRLLGTDPPAAARRRRPPEPAAPGAKRVYKGRQTSLWSRPTLLSAPLADGQYPLPFPATRDHSRAHRTATHPDPTHQQAQHQRPAYGRAPGQRALWARSDLSNEPRPDGQYPLPFPITRVPPPPSRAPSPSAAPTQRDRAATVGRQLTFPLALFDRRPGTHDRPHKGTGR